MNERVLNKKSEIVITSRYLSVKSFYEEEQSESVFFNYCYYHYR